MPKPEIPNSDSAWFDPDDAPDWTPEVFELAEVAQGDQILQAATGVLKRGRPKLGKLKIGVTLRVDPDVLGKLRADGPGWPTRADRLLRKAVGL